MKEYKVEGFDPEKLQGKLTNLGAGGWDLDHISYIEKQLIASRVPVLVGPPAPPTKAGVLAWFSRLKGDRTLYVAATGAIYVVLRLLGVVPEGLVNSETQGLLDKLLGFGALIFAALKGKRIEKQLGG